MLRNVGGVYADLSRTVWKVDDEKMYSIDFTAGIYTQTNPSESKYMFSPLRLYTSVLHLFHSAVEKFEVQDRHMSFHVWHFTLNKFYTT